MDRDRIRLLLENIENDNTKFDEIGSSDEDVVDEIKYIITDYISYKYYIISFTYILFNCNSFKFLMTFFSHKMFNNNDIDQKSKKVVRV